MSEVKIGVAGNADAARAAVNVMTDAVNKLQKAVASANQVPYKAPGIEQATKDLARLQKQFQDAIKQSASLRNALKNSGQNGDAGILNVDWSKLSIDPKAAQRIRDRAFAYSARGTGWELGTPAPPVPAAPGGGSGRGGRGGSGGGRGGGDGNFFSRVGRSFSSGFGGTAGRVANGALEGAESGAAGGGGLMGGLRGIARGGMAALAVGGAIWAGKSLNEGFGMAKERAMTLDTLKRQMGDLGVSFDKLKDSTTQVATSLGVNAVQFAQSELQLVQSSHGGYRDINQLRGATADSIGFSRAFGIDPSQMVGFTGAMRSMDPRQNNRDLAAYIAEAITRAGGHALPQDVMQAVLSLSSAASRLSLAGPNVGAMTSAYGSMLAQNQPGLTAENVGSILSSANSAFQNMGGAGEAGRNFIMQAMNGVGGTMLNPIEAQALATQGLFGSRAEAFGRGSILAKYARSRLGSDDPRLAALAGSPGANTLNFTATRDHLHKLYGNDWESELDAAKNVFGVGSTAQAASLMMLNPGQYGGLQKAMKEANVSMDKLTPSGIMTMAQIGSAGTMGDLRKVYADLSKRTGADSLTDSERDRLSNAEGSGSFKEFRDELLRVAASKGQEDTQATDIRSIKTTLDNAKILAGDALLGPVLDIERGVTAILAHLTGQNPGTETGGDGRATDAYIGDSPSNWFDQARSWIYKQGAEGSAVDRLKSPGGRAKLDYLTGLEQQYGLPDGLMAGVWGTESTFGANVGESSAGARGNFQQMPATADQYGVKIGDFRSEADGAARQLRDLIKKHNGDMRGALFDYNGVIKNIGAGEKYVNNVHQYSAMASRAHGTDFPIVPYDGGNPDADKIPESTSSSPKSSDTKDGVKSGTVEKGVDGKQTVVLDIGLNLAIPGQPSQGMKTSVEVPRGNGNQHVAMTASTH